MRPRPTQAWAAAHIGQCSPEVYTVAADRSAGVRLSTAQRAIANSGCRVWSPSLTRLRSSKRVLPPGRRGSNRTVVAVVERLAREFDAAAKADPVVVADGHRPRVYGLAMIFGPARVEPIGGNFRDATEGGRGEVYRRLPHRRPRQILSCLTDDVVWELHGAKTLVGKNAFATEADSAGGPNPQLTPDRLVVGAPPACEGTG